MTAYYNEIDPYAAQWLRNLIKENLIAPGDVDERDIANVKPNDLKGYTQCHFFAGIGGWSRALRLSMWPDNRHVWTGSCPCQPFSVASVAHGGAKGQGDKRHLWPEFCSLIGKRKPDTIFGEQVSDALGWGWWDTAALDLEAKAYACAAAVLRADGFGAIHRRKRLFWVAHAGGPRWSRYKPIDGLSLAEAGALALDGDPLDRAWRVLALGDDDLLSGDGVSVAVERCATTGYGNAIVPQVAAAFIQASC